MSILIDKKTVVLIQGITGHEGARTANEMQAYGTKVVAGVTPGKGGQKVAGNIPVYNTVAEALAAHSAINASLITVPAAFAADAALEAITHHLPLVNILTEKMPVADVTRVIYWAKHYGVTLVGPSSVGIITPRQTKLGAIAAVELADRVFTPGPIGVISKSGGMTAELSRILTDAGLGQSTAVGIGGDIMLGTTFLDCARLFQKDKETKALVIFGEVGGVYEEQLAEALRTKEITKPVVALIAGDFSKLLPRGTVLGHAGAIVTGQQGSAKSKIAALKKAGARISKSPEDIPRLVKKLL